MRTKCYLMVTKGGGVRFAKTAATPRSDEIGMQVNIEVPDAVFKRPYPVATISIPDSPTDTDAIVEVTADAVAKVLNVDATEVRDGLNTALANAERARVG